MGQGPMKIVVLGLTITSSWGNGHATVFRGLLRAMAERGHRVLFLERDKPWYADNRDMPDPPFCLTRLYQSVEELRQRWARQVREADAVIVGSYVPEGVAVGRWARQTARGACVFYDIDTPVTLGKLARQDYEYIDPAAVAEYDAYLSFTGGPTLDRLERELGSPMARPLYCCVDASLYYPEPIEPSWNLGYMGTYSDDRQPTVESLLIEPALRWPGGRFVVAGPQYPRAIKWPGNVERIEHLPPAEHRLFYNRQRYTLNVTRRDMIRAGHAPSVRLFEAGACGVPIVSDDWEGLGSILTIGKEILVARSSDEALSILRETDEITRRSIGEAARRRVLAEHTAERRAEQLETHLRDALDLKSQRNASALAG